MSIACMVVANVEKHRSVLLQCSNDRDQTSQIASLVEIMLDSYYRTINGFQMLVEREWIQFGDRCGHGVDTNERCPVFLQWLDCIYLIMVQDQTAFQFNELFLVKLKKISV